MILIADRVLGKGKEPIVLACSLKEYHVPSLPGSVRTTVCRAESTLEVHQVRERPGA